MKTLYLFIASLLLYVQSSAQTWQWTHPEKNANQSGYYQAHDIEVDASGNIYVLGDFDDSLFLNNNFIKKGGGSYLAKYDSTGSLLWYKTIIPTYEPDFEYEYSIRATDLTVNTSGVYITGKYRPSTGVASPDCSTVGYLRSYKFGDFNFSSSIADASLFITKFNSNGAVIWNKTATDPSICPDGRQTFVYVNPFITSDKANNIVCAFICRSDTALQINGDLILLRGGQNLVVAKYNSGGSLQWSNSAGGGFAILEGGSNSIITDKNNNIFIVGSASDSTFFGSQLYRTTTSPDNGTYAQSTFIAKISSSGVWQFAKELCNNVISILVNPDQLCADNQNNIYALVNSYPYGGSKPLIILGDTIAYYADYLFTQYLVKLKNNGALVWQKGFDGPAFAYDNSYSMCFANNSLYLTGMVSISAPAFGNLTIQRNPLSYGGEYFVAKANTDGNFQWVTSAGSTGGMEGLAVRAFNNNIYTAGYYGGNIINLGNLNGSYTAAYKNIFFGKLKDQYVKVGAVTPTTLIPGCTITIPFTSYGLTFSNKNKFTAELSNANGDFTAATTIGSVKSTGTGSITATIPASLPYSSGYRVRIHSTDTLKTGLNYYAYADTGYRLTLLCDAPSSGFAAANITATSATLNWNVVDCAKGYKVQYRIKGTGAWTTANINTNTGSVNLTGLTANTTYQWRVATKCKNNGTTSFSEYSAIKQFTTAAAFVSADIRDAVTTALQGLQLKVEPNPTSSTALLVISSKVTNANVVIADLTGKTIWKQDGINTAQLNLPVQHLLPGVYIVKLLRGDKIYVAKLIKQ